MKLTLSKLFGITLLCAATQHANAFETWECLGEDLKWSSNTVNLRYSANSFSNSARRASMDTAIARVNQNPTPFRLTRTLGDTSVALNNGQNEVWFSSSSSILNGAPAVTYLYWDCIDYWIFGKDVELTETDVIFSNSTNYTTSMSKSNLLSHGGSARPLQTTAIHEFGHVFGLDHTANTYSVMGQDWDHIHANGSSARAYLGEDAAHGMAFLYGQSSSGAEDVGVTHFKRTGASSAGYARHDPTVVRSSSNANLATTPVGNELAYRVNRGQTVRLELSYENNGRTFRNEDIGYYVSTNNYISTFDTLLTTKNKSLARNTVYTTSDNLTIPTNLTRGRVYYLGAIIDKNGSLSEMTEVNNATYVPIYIN